MKTGSTHFRVGQHLLSLAIVMLLCTTARAAEPASGEAPRYTNTMSEVLNLYRYDAGEADWPNSFTRTFPVTLSQSTRARADGLGCHYKNPAEPRNSREMRFWKDRRPDFSQVTEGDINHNGWGIRRVVYADIALDRCPATWGAALALVWGPKAPRELQALARDFQKGKNDAEQAKVQAAIDAWQAEARALPPLSPAQERELALQVDAELSRMESGIDGLNSRPFNDALKGPLGDRIVRLSQLAYVKSSGLNAGGAGRAAFDAWDNRLGGPALTAIDRIEKIIHYRMNRRLRLMELKTSDEALREMESWGNVELQRFKQGRDFLLNFMTEKLAGKALLDPVFLKKIASDLERDRPKGDPGRPYYRHVPADPKPAWTMTPEEQEAQDNGKLLGGAVAIVQGIGDLIRLIEKVDGDVRESRKAFWHCYATRCKDAGKAFYAFSSALNAKDQWIIFRPVVTHGLLAPGMALLGDANVDGGNIAGCAAEMEGLTKALSPKVPLDQLDAIGRANLVLATMKGPAYAAWQGCRDRMEYILRPRFP